jgi:glycosyltransferase involved in cell wall biosynthesis
VPRPFVSILIDTYNHERFIEEAIVSVLEQDFPASDGDIIIVDDGSTDRTPEIVRKFEPKVRLLRKPNGGQASAFNAGIPECKGEIIAFLDGDDWWERNKLSTVVHTLENNPAIGTVGHGLYEVNESGERVFCNTPNRDYECYLRSPGEAKQFTELMSFLGTSRLAIRKAVLEKILPLPEELLIEADEFLATFAVAISGCHVLKEPLTCYRLHAGNLYQFSEFNEAKVERKWRSLECLARDLPPRLIEAGVSPGVVQLLTAPNWINATRSRLALGHGHAWETAQIEHAAFRQIYSHASIGYYIFHVAVLMAACIFPPRLFYRLRRWYAARGLARIRGAIGKATTAPSLVVRNARHP